MTYLEFKDLLKKATFLPFKPKLLLRVINNYLNIIIFRKRLLRCITIWATWECQCNCFYCSNYKIMEEAGERQTLVLQDYENIFRSIRELGAIHVGFVGGEPLLFKELVQLIKAAKPSSMIISLTTNGILLNDKAHILRKAGLDLVNVTIDSPYGCIHDEHKGFVGSFKQALDGIMAAKEAGIKIIITFTLTHQNLNNGDVEKMIDLTKRLGVELQLLPLKPMGKLQGNQELLLDRRDAQTFYALASRWKIRWDGRTNYFKTGCPAGTEKLTIDIFGNVYPCDFINIPFGNVLKTPLRDIYSNMRESKMFAKWSPVCRSIFDHEFIKEYHLFDR